MTVSTKDIPFHSAAKVTGAYTHVTLCLNLTASILRRATRYSYPSFVKFIPVIPPLLKLTAPHLTYGPRHTHISFQPYLIPVLSAIRLLANTR
jgi:hypothetical protein